MKFVKVSDNILVNPECISCIEQKDIRGKNVIVVWVDGKSYTVTVPIKQFIKELEKSDEEIEQHFAG